MLSDKIFQAAFIISLITHGIVLFQNQKLNLGASATIKKEQLIKVNYLANTQENKKYMKTRALSKKPFLKLLPQIAVVKTTSPPFIDKEGIFRNSKEIISQKYIFTKPAIIKQNVMATKKKITLPPIDMDKINDPSYLSYYQIVREKIRRAAYQNYSHTEVGEVYLSFAILSGGSLKKIQLVEERSSPSPYLREISLKSIKEASPFPNFPKELDYPQLSFNVVISFEVE